MYTHGMATVAEAAEAFWSTPRQTRTVRLNDDVDLALNAAGSRGVQRGTGDALKATAVVLTAWLLLRR